MSSSLSALAFKVPRKKTAQQIESLLQKKLLSTKNEAYRFPTFPYTRNPLQLHNIEIDQFTPVCLSTYKANYSGNINFYAKRTRHELQFDSLYKWSQKKEYSTIPLGRFNLLNGKSQSLNAFEFFKRKNEKKKDSRAAAYFLLANAVLVFGMVALGGWTRLTESGLSMVDWNLIHFTPPQGEAEWEAYFEKYKQYPEFQVLNKDMTLEQFKRIYYMEFWHRVMGRLTGAFCLIGSAALIGTGKVKVRSSIGYSLAFMNVGYLMQGLMGWVMVKSGLDDSLLHSSHVPRVYPGYLAIHLTNAFILYGFTLYNGLKLLIKNERGHLANVSGELAIKTNRFLKLSYAAPLTVFITAVSGALVAGNDAGLVYNSWPLMADRWIPSDVWAMKPWYKNFVENSATVQFDHRLLAYSSIGVVSLLFNASRGLPLGRHTKLAVHSMLGMVLIQSALGITTLLTYVPITLGSIHQMGSLVLLSLGTYLGVCVF